MAFLTPIPIISLILILRVIGNHSASIGSSHPIPQVRLDQSRSSPLLSPNGSSGLCPMRGAKQKCSWNWTTIFWGRGGEGGGDVKVLILQGFEGFDVITTVYSKANHAKTSKKQKNQTPLGQKSDSVDMWSAVLFFVFLDFRGFCMVCSKWPEPRKSKKNKKTKLPTTCPQSQTRAPMGSAVLFFLIFEVLAIWSRPCKNLGKKNKTADPIGALV